MKPAGRRGHVCPLAPLTEGSGRVLPAVTPRAVLEKLGRVADEFAGHPSPFPTTAWRGYILSWYDSDTPTVRFDAGFYGTFVRSVRVYGINAPELHTGSQRNRAKSAKALAYTLTIAPGGTPVDLVTSMAGNTEDPGEKYNRVLAKIMVYRPDGSTFDYGAEMLAAGLVVAYNPDPGPNPVPAAKRGSREERNALPERARKRNKSLPKRRVR